MEIEQEIRLPLTAYHLAEQYQIGQPLALHSMRPQQVRLIRVIRRLLPGIVICTMLFIFALLALFAFQYLTLLTQHPTNLFEKITLADQLADFRWRLLSGLPAIITGLLGCAGCIIARHIIARNMPVSLLIGTEGLLEIRPRGVIVTRWNETRSTLQEFIVGKKKRYKLTRSNRKSLLFGDVFEDSEGLVKLIKQMLPSAG